MNVLVIGNGGREHAIAWKVARSPDVGTVYVAPGNAGTQREPGIQNVSIGAEDTTALVDFARNYEVGLTIVGPEVPLVMGLVDLFQQAGLRCFGPTRAAAELEGSKAFSKAFLERNGIPTARYRSFIELGAAQDYIHDLGAPLVIKADGLAAGKGVVVAHTLDEALQAAEEMLSGAAFGGAGQRIVVEEFLEGEEASFIALVDGEDVLPLASSQDHKPRDEGDTGPNTGGMGAYSPASAVTPELHRRIMQEIVTPTVRSMNDEGRRYTGFLYAGIMIASDGSPRVLEYNVRLGDPETQPIMMRLRSDLLALCLAALEGRLKEVSAEWDDRAALGVVMASRGYPGAYSRGHVIRGLPEREQPDRKVFHAGTALDEHGNVVTAGGRVLCACALGETVTQAQTRAYELADSIHWDGAYYRRDIGYRAATREAGA